MEARREERRQANEAQYADHATRKDGLKGELFERGSAKRRALATDGENLRRLEAVIAEDHAEMVSRISPPPT